VKTLCEPCGKISKIEKLNLNGASPLKINQGTSARNKK
jgi:hypothetical protein